MTIKDADRKNCLNCQHLEWVDGESESDTGFTCNKRYEGYWHKDKDDWLLAKLDDASYRMKSKVCFERAE